MALSFKGDFFRSLHYALLSKESYFIFSFTSFFLQTMIKKIGSPISFIKVSNICVKSMAAVSFQQRRKIFEQ
jgi:hypothetical protein